MGSLGKTPGAVDYYRQHIQSASEIAKLYCFHCGSAGEQLGLLTLSSQDKSGPANRKQGRSYTWSSPEQPPASACTPVSMTNTNTEIELVRTRRQEPLGYIRGSLLPYRVVLRTPSKGPLISLGVCIPSPCCSGLGEAADRDA